MKPLIGTLLLALLFACTPKTQPESPGADTTGGEPKFAIQEEIYNFGTVQSGEMVSYSFRFSNDGTGNLLITSVETDCGCIQVDYPHEAVKPGDSASIDVLFNTAGEVGQVLKQISVQTNASKKTRPLMITAKVENELFKSYN